MPKFELKEIKESVKYKNDKDVASEEVWSYKFEGTTEENGSIKHLQLVLKTSEELTYNVHDLFDFKKVGRQEKIGEKENGAKGKKKN